jgi:hypothetical protein
MADQEQHPPTAIIEHEIRPPNRGERGPRGHFAPGNKFSVGRKKRPLLYRDVREILKQEDVERIVDDLRRLAGDPAVEVGSRIAASKVLLDRYFGPPKAPPVRVPNLEDGSAAPEPIAELTRRLLGGVVTGTVDAATADAILAVLEKGFNVLEYVDLERRLVALEQEIERRQDRKAS